MYNVINGHVDPNQMQASHEQIRRDKTAAETLSLDKHSSVQASSCEAETKCFPLIIVLYIHVIFSQNNTFEFRFANSLIKSIVKQQMF